MEKYFKNVIFIWSWVKTEKVLFFISIFFSILIFFTGTITPIFYKHIIDIASKNDITKSVWLINLYRILIYLAILAWVNQLWWRFLGYFWIKFETNLKKKLYLSAFDYLNKHSYKFFSDNMSWSLIKRINRFVSGILNISWFIYFEYMSAFFAIFGSLIVITYNNIYLWVLYIVYLLILFSLSIFFTKDLLVHRKNFVENESYLNWFVADVISNHFNIQLFASEKKEFKSFSWKIDDNVKLQKKYLYKMEIMFWIISSSFAISELILYYLAIRFWGNSFISIWTFVLIITYQLRVSSVVFGLPSYIRKFHENISDIDEMREILDKPHDIIDIENAKDLHISKWEIIFEDVWFKYFEWQEEVISKLNLTIKPWEKVALVWVSWSGKSTIIKLILRLYDLTSGKILIDWEDIAEITQESLRKNIWLVPQEPVLFHRTLAENISYGKDNATLDEIIKVSKEAECHKFISSQEKGYDTLVGERWIKLSWWERQRVAIARVLLKNAKILLLDEATSALDSESEILIQKAMDKAMNWKTTIAIAHRLSTIMKMDRIVVLEKWKIVEDGSHSELLTKEGWVYKKLWEIQSGGFIGE